MNALNDAMKQAQPAPPAGPAAPAAPFESKEIDSLASFLAEVASLTAGGRDLWFRGTRDADRHQLLPSLYRHPKLKNDASELRQLEIELMTAFKHRGVPFREDLPHEDLELLFLMQHHGVPTRLLDWSENPFVALFFALENARQEDPGAAPPSAVWVLDPVALNQTALANNNGSGRILAANDDLLNAYQPNGSVKNSGKLPVAMHGVHNSQRIVAQRGVFVLFGTGTTPLDNEQQLPAGTLKKLVIAKNVKVAMFDALFRMGVTDSVIYPDLDGLGREIKNRYGY